MSNALTDNFGGVYNVFKDGLLDSGKGTRTSTDTLLDSLAVYVGR